MINFEFHLPTRIIFGKGEIRRSGDVASTLGEKAMLIIGRGSVKRYGYYDKVVSSLKDKKVEFVTFEGVEPNPRSTTVDKAGEIAKRERVDFLVGLGGGSVMDATKAAAVRALVDNPIWEYIQGENGKPPRRIKNALPTMMIPTVAATSSETDCGGVITNWEEHRKRSIINPLLFPKVSIIDPELTVTVGADTTADGAVDIISHVLESYLSGDPNSPVQDRFTEGLIRTVVEYAPKAIENPADINARSNLSWCASLALSGFVNSGRGGNFPIHIIEHSLSAHYDISHGSGLALLIPPIMRFTGRAVPERLRMLGRNVFYNTEYLPSGKSDVSAEETVRLFEKCFHSLGRKLTFSELGIDDSKFERMADDIISMFGGEKGYLENPQPIYKKDIIDIFNSVR